MGIRQPRRRGDTAREDMKEKLTPQERNVIRYKKMIHNPMTEIRAFCVECMGGYLDLVANCPAETCPHWRSRMGKNPYHPGRKDRVGVAIKRRENDNSDANSDE